MVSFAGAGQGMNDDDRCQMTPLLSALSDDMRASKIGSGSFDLTTLGENGFTGAEVYRAA